MISLTVIEIIKERLIADGFDGLVNPGCCACLVEDLEPCGAINASDCAAGYRIECPPGCEDEHAWHITENRPVKKISDVDSEIDGSSSTGVALKEEQKARGGHVVPMFTADDWFKVNGRGWIASCTGVGEVPKIGSNVVIDGYEYVLMGAETYLVGKGRVGMLIRGPRKGTV